jgi:hypothetical protein
MVRAKDLIMLTATVSILSTIATGCRTGLRPQTNPGDPVSVEIKIIGMKEADRSRTELVYTLAGCGGGNTSGTKDADNKVSFQTQNVRKDDRCDLKVLTDKADIGVASWFSDQGLMYDARRVPITSDQGKLSGVAFVQQLYATPPTIQGLPSSTIWQLGVGVKGPKAFSDICTCSIGCQPSLVNNVSKLDVSADPKVGVCSFANVIKADSNRIECRKLVIQCGADFYVGNWSSGTFIDGSQAKSQLLPDVTVQAGIPEEVSDTTIEVVIPN